MKKILLSITALLIITASVVRADGELIVADTPWKKSVQEFAAKHLEHSAWGYQHSERNYLLALKLAAADQVAVDTDVLFAAAYLHDMGGFAEFEKPGVDHAVRSAELCEGILVPAGFPKEKITAVKGVILAHTYYNPNAPVTPEEIVFHDADLLDFLGVIGITRIVSITKRETPDLKGSISLVEKLFKQVQPKLAGATAQKMAKERLSQGSEFLKILLAESFGGKAL